MSDKRPNVPMWRRALSIGVLCIAFALLFPVAVLAWGLIGRTTSTDVVQFVGLSALVLYPAMILIAIALFIRWHRSPKPPHDRP